MDVLKAGGRADVLFECRDFGINEADVRVFRNDTE